LDGRPIVAPAVRDATEHKRGAAKFRGDALLADALLNAQSLNWTTAK
jgi:hypothetical protein